MSSTVTPIQEISDSQRNLAEDGLKRTLLAKEASDDLADRVQGDAVALGVRLAQLRSQDETMGHIKEALAATDAEITTPNSAGIRSRLNDLALQAASNVLSADQREAVRIEVESLQAALDRIATTVGGSRTATAPATEEAAAQETNALVERSNLSGDIILGHTDASVHAQANQDAGGALKLLDNE